MHRMLCRPAAVLCVSSVLHSSSNFLGRCEGNRDAVLKRSFVADCVEIASPSVVNIQVQISSGFSSGMSTGSGFVITRDGFIVTNAHVVREKGASCSITMWDGRKRRGVVHSLDPSSDVALVQMLDIDSNEDLPCAKLGSSASLRAGEFVVALGSPMNLNRTASFGIVSSTARPASDLGVARSRNEYIQSDVPTNRGNSGGPLCNLDGEVVGINTLKAGGDMENISFAVPIDIAKEIVKQLMKNKVVVRPYLGMKAAPLKGGSGQGQVVVNSVDKNSPAERAGLLTGDIILRINGKKVVGMQSVFQEVGVQVGRRFDFDVLRRGFSGGSGEELQICIVSIPDPQAAARG